MGLGDMFNKIFKKEEGKGGKTVEISDEKKTMMDVKNMAETPRTENIHKLETLSIEEAVDQTSQPREKDDYKGDKDEQDLKTESGTAQPISSQSGSTEPADTSGVEPASDQVTEEKVFEILSDIYDPEIPIDIVNLGLVYGVQVEDGIVNVKMTLTSPGCPTAGQMVQEAQMLIEELPGVKEAIVEVVWDPPWDPSKMSEEAKRALGYI
ncbi:MAG TPA: metal-sulfur cluster assembly factor [Thermodesulfobacteriota bacterium]|nr:metal-sulfur cluster assembly factor [Thermodesulfobacteriota bacterium]